MSDYGIRYKSGYKYRSKLVVDGTVDKVKRLHDEEKKSFEEIGAIIGKSKARVSQIYYKAVAPGY